MKFQLAFCNITASLILLITSDSFSQSITNSLGTDGVFTIKDATDNFLTLSQSTGEVNILRSLRLENTTSSDIGIIFKGTDRFMHNYQPPSVQGHNTFVGINSGNFTMTGSTTTASSNNTGIGFGSLLNLTSGYQNTSVGSYSLQNNSEGNSNTGFGYSSLYSNVSGSSNTSVGNKSLYANTIGSGNTAVGNLSLIYNTEGNFNTAVGNLSLGRNILGEYNTAVGFKSLWLSDGTFNTAMGYLTLQNNTNGSFNTVFGGFSGQTIICRSPKLGQVVKVELIKLSKKTKTWQSRAGASSAQTSRQRL